MPVSDWPAVTVIQGSLLVAVQLQAVAVRRRRSTFSRPAPVDMLNGDIEYVQFPSCVIWKILLTIEIAPLRTNGLMFGWTESQSCLDRCQFHRMMEIHD